MSAKKTILLIRHAETDLAGTFCGVTDPPINDKGRLQIEQLLAELKPYPLDTVYCSDLQRARQTAEAVAKSSSSPLQVSLNLREIGFGEWEGLTWEQAKDLDPVFAQRWADEFPQLPTPGGEEFGSFEVRALNEFDTVIASDQAAAIVTHAGVLRVILARRCGLSEEQAWLQSKTYCGVFVYPGGGAER